MSDTENLKEILVKTLGGIDTLIQRENHSDRLVKAASDAAKRLDDLETKIKASQQQLVDLEAQKETSISSAKKLSLEIVKEADAKLAAAEASLLNAKKTEKQAQERLVEAETTRQTYENMLNAVQAQKDKLRVALGA